MGPVELTGQHSIQGFAPDAEVCSVEVDQTRPVEENLVWNLIVNDRTLGVQRPVTCAAASGRYLAVAIGWFLSNGKCHVAYIG